MLGRLLLAASMLALACGGATHDGQSAASSAGNQGSLGGDRASGGDHPSGGDQAGGSSVVASGPLERIFQGAFGLGFNTALEECAADGSCADGMSCFHLARELAVCDLSQQLESDQCTVPLAVSSGNKQSDQCGCGGLTCATGKACVTASNVCSCEPQVYNACVDVACSSAADCASPTVCTPTSFIRPQSAPNPNYPAVGRCTPTACGSDADCTIERGGRCSVLLADAAQGVANGLGVGCAYPGSASDPGVCPAEVPVDIVGRSREAFHSCYALSP